jgi:hypothetical protein
MSSLPPLLRNYPQKVDALEAGIRCLDAEIIDVIADIAALEDRHDELERKQDSLRARLHILLTDREGGL